MSTNISHIQDSREAELAKALGLDGHPVTWGSMIKTVKERCVADWLNHAFDEVVAEREAALAEIETLRDKVLDLLYSEHERLENEMLENGFLDYHPNQVRLEEIEAEIAAIRKAREDEDEAQL